MISYFVTIIHIFTDSASSTVYYNIYIYIYIYILYYILLLLLMHLLVLFLLVNLYSSCLLNKHLKLAY